MSNSEDRPMAETKVNARTRELRPWMLTYSVAFLAIWLAAWRESNYGTLRSAWNVALYVPIFIINFLYSFNKVPLWISKVAAIVLPVVVLDEIISFFIDGQSKTQAQPLFVTLFTVFSIGLTLLPTCIVLFKLGYARNKTQE